MQRIESFYSIWLFFFNSVVLTIWLMEHIIGLEINPIKNTKKNENIDQFDPSNEFAASTDPFEWSLMAFSSNSQWETSWLKYLLLFRFVFSLGNTGLQTQYAVHNDWVHQLWMSALRQSNLVSRIFHHILWIVEIIAGSH